MTEQPPQRTRLTKSKATSSTTAIQTLEITTTAIVTSVPDKHAISPSTTEHNDTNIYKENSRENPKDNNDNEVHNDNSNNDLYRKQSHHHHHHHIRSPGFEAGSALTSPLLSQQTEHMPAEINLPPPILKGHSEAIVALQDAANDISNKKTPKKVPTDIEPFDSSFFSAALLIQWSNLVGPKVERVWSVEPLKEKLQMLIGRQVLNGEMGRSIREVEPKWIVLNKQGIICTAFLFQDPTIQSLCAFVLVVPIRYLRNFSQYFNVLCERVPSHLIQALVKLRKLHKRHSISWLNALDYFTLNRLIPFVKSIMDLESVSLPLDCIKTSYTILDQESRHRLETPFIAKIITSHLQTYGTSLLMGNTITTMNRVINTLALFLTSEERSRSSHARKHHHYMPDLYLQGILIQDAEEMDTKIELAVLDSILPTTFVDMTKQIVKRTHLYHEYDQLKNDYYEYILSRLEDNLVSYINDPNKSKVDMQDWSKRNNIFHQSDSIAPMVQTLLDETHKVPTRMREAYVKHWRRGLVRRAMAMIKFVQEEIHQTDDLVAKIKYALSLYNEDDFTIVLTQAEKLRPGMAAFIRNYSKNL